MKINVMENTPLYLRFKLSGADFNVANTIRRIATNSVKCFAVDKVTFYENSSPMFDEYIAHRIGLVPLSSPAKGYSDDDQIAFSLSGEGPGTVYSKDLKSSDKGIKVVNDKIPIIKLAEGQSIKLDAKAVMGAGQQSAKFQPGLVTYKSLSDTEFEFYIETFGQMPPTEILSRTLSIITDNVKEVQKQIKK